VDPAGRRDRNQPRNRAAMIGDFDGVAALDVTKITTRLLPELANPD
jgi:hypothetical protein